MQLESVPTAGYGWQITECPQEVTVVVRTVTPQGAAMGGSAVETFVFRADGPGTYDVSLCLKRPWEREPIDTRTYRIRVG